MDGKSGLFDPVLGGVTPPDLYEEVDSHAGEERHSVLEPVYEYMQVLPASHLQTDRTAIYPRIKKMADGRYILFCQGGQIASRIYYYTSDDLKSWRRDRCCSVLVKSRHREVPTCVVIRRPMPLS